MGLDFTKPAMQPAPAQDSAAAPAMTSTVNMQNTQIEEVKQYDIAADRQALEAQYVNSEEVDKIASQIEVYNPDTIVTFGAEAAEGISKASDTVLRNINMSQIDKSGDLMKILAKIMNEFDIEEIQEDPKGFKKWFGNARKQLDAILSKYHTMGDEVDKIFVQLRKYEDEIRQSNKSLNQMFEANVDYYHQLVKYILAGEQGCREIEKYIEQRTNDMQTTGDQSIQFELTSLQQALSMLEQRVQDLRMAEMVAMQSVPMLKTMEFSNYNLVRKINSAFIVTLPVFKQALAQAVLLKRQKVQADSMQALDQKTNELLLRNATNTVDISKQVARMASTSSIQIETLEKTWQTIMTGIEETQKIQQEGHAKRLEDQKRLETMKQQFNEKYHMPAQKK